MFVVLQRCMIMFVGVHGALETCDHVCGYLDSVRGSQSPSSGVPITVLENVDMV